MNKFFLKPFHEALSKAPALLIFDDLDLLLSAPNNVENDDELQLWLCEWFQERIYKYIHKLHMFESNYRRKKSLENDNLLTKYALNWIATGRNRDSLQPILLQTFLFDRIVQMNPLNPHYRTLLLKSEILKLYRRLKIPADSKNIAFLNLEIVAIKAEGYYPFDLIMLAERAIHTSLMRSFSNLSLDKDYNLLNFKEKSLNLTHQDFLNALKDYKPFAMRGIKSTKTDVRWSTIGGLTYAKKVLKETLELPIQFSSLYQRSPQQLASGILLYGPPGCGKTLLAQAVANECSLNFFSVKGPEIFNKYIGASEQAIRDLFLRANAVTPSIIFFDEFDALAPRRGSDYSGVTDRVVNQILTFLDGIESRQGLYVMAATSRPDFLDPALLRPGRFEKHIFCNFPTSEERLDIIRVLSKNIDFEPAALDRLEKLATSNRMGLYTGADLHSIFYSLQLEFVHSKIDCNQEKKLHDRESSIEATNQVRFSHLEKVLSEMRPSISKKDNLNYRKIYDMFRRGDMTLISNKVYSEKEQYSMLK